VVGTSFGEGSAGKGVAGVGTFLLGVIEPPFVTVKVVTCGGNARHPRETNSVTSVVSVDSCEWSAIHTRVQLGEGLEP